MNRLKYKIAAWMQGRYGVDALYKALVALYFILFALSLFLFRPLYYVSLAVLGYSLYRVLSKNLSARAEENRRYLAISGNIKKKTLLFINRFKFHKTHRYRTCPNCKTALRLPKKIGTMTVNCPVCHHTFQATINR